MLDGKDGTLNSMSSDPSVGIIPTNLCLTLTIDKTEGVLDTVSPPVSEAGHLKRSSRLCRLINKEILPCSSQWR